MSLFNKFFKSIFYVLIYAWTFIQSYLLSAIITSVILSLTMTVFSLINSIPAILIYRFWLVLLVGSIPLGIVFFLMIIFDFVKRFKK